MIKNLFIIFLLSWSFLSLAEREGFFYDEMDEMQQWEIGEGEEVIEVDSFQKELRNLGYKDLGIETLKDPKVKDLVAKQFDASNISLMSLKDKKKIFDEQFKKSRYSKVFEKFPKLQDILIDVMTDKNSILGLMTIIQKHKRIYFIYILVSALIINLILKKIFARSSNFLFRFIQRLTINLFTSFLIIMTLFFIYKKELTPVVRLVASHL